MDSDIKKHLLKYSVEYEPIPVKYITIIHDLFFKDIRSDVQDDIVLLYHGVYYYINKDYDAMVKYFIMAVGHGSVIAMTNLAYHYSRQGDHNNTVKYYLMAIEYNYVPAMAALAYHYEVHNIHDDAVKYYLMAIDHNHIIAMNNLAVYYEKHHDNVNAVKYYLIGISHNNASSMNNLAMYYIKLNNYVIASKYWCMAIVHNNYELVDYTLTTCKRNNLIEYGIIYINKLLNKPFEYQTISFIKHFANNMNIHLLNTIINMPYLQTDDELFDKFKNLLV